MDGSKLKRGKSVSAFQMQEKLEIENIETSKKESKKQTKQLKSPSNEKSKEKALTRNRKRKEAPVNDSTDSKPPGNESSRKSPRKGKRIIQEETEDTISSKKAFAKNKNDKADKNVEKEKEIIEETNENKNNSSANDCDELNASLDTSQDETLDTSLTKKKKKASKTKRRKSKQTENNDSVPLDEQDNVEMTDHAETSVDSQEQDPELEDIDLNNVDNGQVAMETRDGVLVGLPHPFVFMMKGKAVIETVCGVIDIMEYRLFPGHSYHVYSPKCNSLVTLATKECETNIDKLDELCFNIPFNVKNGEQFNKFKTKLKSLKQFVVLHLKKVNSPGCCLATASPPYTDLFSFQGDGSSFNKKLLPLGVMLTCSQGDVPLLEVTGDLSNVLGEWTEAVDNTDQVIVVCGGQNTGKSTTNRFLINTTLNRLEGVYYLECDLGQTEFTPPACISLHHVTKPVLGPPFCHQREPVCSYHTGCLSPRDDPDSYIRCVQRCVEAYIQVSPKAPLIVNTMGWMKGLGLQLLVDIVRLVSPTHIVQMMSWQHSQNAPVIRPDFPWETSWTDLSRENYTDLRDNLQPHRDPLIMVLNSPVPHNLPSKQSNFKASDHRNLSVLSHLGNNLELGLTLTSIQPYCVPWQDVAVHVCGVAVPRSQVMYSLNASLVALCHADLSKAHPDIAGGPLFFDKLPACEWLGYGIVRGIDRDKKALIVITTLPDKVLTRANTIVKGAVTLPDHLLLSQKCPNLMYIDEPIRSTGAASLKQRSHMPRAGLQKDGPKF